MLGEVAQEIVNNVVEQAADDLELLKALRSTSSIFDHATRLTFRTCRLPVTENNLADLFALLYVRPYLVRDARDVCLVRGEDVPSPLGASHADLVTLVRLAPKLQNLRLNEFAFIITVPELTEIRPVMTLILTSITRVIEDNVVTDFVAADLSTTTTETYTDMFASAGPLRLCHRNAVSGFAVPGPRPSNTWFFGGENLLPAIALGLHIALGTFRDTLKVVMLDLALFPYATHEWQLLRARVCPHLRAVNLRINLHTFNRITNSAQGFNMNQVLSTLPLSVTHVGLHFAYAHADSFAFTAHIAQIDWVRIGRSLQKLLRLETVVINLCPRIGDVAWKVADRSSIEIVLRSFLPVPVTFIFLHPGLTGEVRRLASWAVADTENLDISAFEEVM